MISLLNGGVYNAFSLRNEVARYITLCLLIEGRSVPLVQENEIRYRFTANGEVLLGIDDSRREVFSEIFLVFVVFLFANYVMHVLYCFGDSGRVLMSTVM